MFKTQDIIKERLARVVHKLLTKLRKEGIRLVDCKGAESIFAESAYILLKTLDLALPKLKDQVDEVSFTCSNVVCKAEILVKNYKLVLEFSNSSNSLEVYRGRKPTDLVLRILDFDKLSFVISNLPFDLHGGFESALRKLGLEDELVKIIIVLRRAFLFAKRSLDEAIIAKKLEVKLYDRLCNVCNKVIEENLGSKLKSYEMLLKSFFSLEMCFPMTLSSYAVLKSVAEYIPFIRKVEAYRVALTSTILLLLYLAEDRGVALYTFSSIVDDINYFPEVMQAPVFFIEVNDKVAKLINMIIQPNTRYVLVTKSTTHIIRFVNVLLHGTALITSKENISSYVARKLYEEFIDRNIRKIAHIIYRRAAEIYVDFTKSHEEVNKLYKFLRERSVEEEFAPILSS